MALFANRLIDELPGKERTYMLKNTQPVELNSGTVLSETRQPIRKVYFPTSSFISQMVSGNGLIALEMGLISNEGMLGATLLLGSNAAPLRAVVQGSGGALSMSRSQFRQAVTQNPVLLSTLNLYLFNMMRQWAQSAFCGRFHQTPPRLARFLLSADDCTDHSNFFITQETLSRLLGVRRSSITVAAGDFQREKRISYSRGVIEILDRPGLEAVACSCYGLTRKT